MSKATNDIKKMDKILKAELNEYGIDYKYYHERNNHYITVYSAIAARTVQNLLYVLCRDINSIDQNENEFEIYFN
jgi:hypothetical protein